MIKGKYLKRSLMGLFIMASAVFINPHSVNAAPVRNVSVKLVQPNGDVLKCFTSGDEFFNYYHDEKGQLIIKNPRTGYYGYGKNKDKKFVPASQKATKGSLENGREVKITDITIPKDEIEKERKLLQVKEPVNTKNSGTLNNLVIFIRFSDQTEFTTGLDVYNSMFNNKTAQANSMYNYYKEASYNKLNINTSFYPNASGNNVLSYKDIHSRDYYVNYKPEERLKREQDLLRRAISHVKNQIPNNLNVDYNNDGFVDNICFVIKGQTEGWSSLLWPHMWSLYDEKATINGKEVKTYNFQLNNHLTNSGVGVLCHEMFHSLGAPDLYHYNYDGTEPTGKWDIMENTSNPPQHMGIHMKEKYGHWISDIPEIKKDGTYSINSIRSSSNNSYIIKSPKNNNEYFMVEYRKASGTFETGLRDSGLLVYRINSKIRGNASAKGLKNNEVYILRKKIGDDENGDVDKANLTEKDSIGEANNLIKFSDGTDSKIKIDNIKIAGERASFQVHFPTDEVTIDKNLPFKGELQSIKDGEKLNGKVQISGWYIYGKDLSKVEVLMDGKIIGQAQLRSNNSLKDKYPEYPLSKAQFIYNLDTTKLTKGNHKITVKATGTDGKEDTLKEKNIVINNDTIDKNVGFNGELESLQDGETISGIKQLKGWFSNDKRIYAADVFVDRKPVGLTTIKSLDSSNKIEFTYNLDTSKFVKGEHNLLVRAVSVDRKTKLIEKKFIIGDKTITGNTGFSGKLQSIKEGDTIKGIVSLTGWASYDKELGMVDIIVDRRPMSLADLEISNNSRKGFEGKLDTTKLSNGKHKLMIRAIGTDRKSKVISDININVAN